MGKEIDLFYGLIWLILITEGKKYSWPLNSLGVGGLGSLHSQKFMYNYSWPSTYVDSQPWIKNM